MIKRLFGGIYHWMAMMGLAMKDDEPLEKRDPDREWGPASKGLMLSAKAKGKRVSVVIKNTGTEEVRADVPAWLFFYHLDISGAPPLSTFGRHALDSRQNVRRTELVLSPGKAIETEIPVDSLYELTAKHVVKVTCDIGSGRLVSNEVTLA